MCVCSRVEEYECDAGDARSDGVRSLRQEDFVAYHVGQELRIGRHVVGGPSVFLDGSVKRSAGGRSGHLLHSAASWGKDDKGNAEPARGALQRFISLKVPNIVIVSSQVGQPGAQSAV